MSSNTLIRAVLFCGITLNSVSCEFTLDFGSFSKIKQGFRVVDEELAYLKFSTISLMVCAIHCFNDDTCDNFQFVNLPDAAMGSCEFLDFGDDLDSFVIPDSSCSIYRYDMEDSDDSGLYRTGIDDSTIANSVCSYAGPPAEYSCNCSTPGFCKGILRCTVNYSNNSTAYMLNRARDIRMYKDAAPYCKGLGMKLLMIKSQEEQATICHILTSVADFGVKHEYWMGLKKPTKGSAPYKYNDGTVLGPNSYNAWLENPPPSDGCVILNWANDGFKWSVGERGDNCNSEKRAKWSGKTICWKLL